MLRSSYGRAITLSIMVTGLYGKVQIRTARPGDWCCHGSTVSKASNPLSVFTSVNANREYLAGVNPRVRFLCQCEPWARSSAVESGSERRLPSSIFNPNRRPTLPFNGYAEEVADLYRGMDLRKFY